MRASLISAALIAAIVGFGGTITLLMAAAAALQATPEQTASWIFAICLAKAAGSALLSFHTRIPVVLAWSTPGAALIAATAGVNMAEGVAAFVFASLLIVLTGTIKPLGALIARIPDPIAAAMLAGVLLPFCLGVPKEAVILPMLVLPVMATFVIVRLIRPTYAVLAALAVGLVLGLTSGLQLPDNILRLPAPVLVWPEWNAAVLLGLGLPLYLVTMASQNLPGFAVLRAAGYEPPVGQALTVSGTISAIVALFCAHPVNMAAITAAICLGDDVHPDRDQRWKVGLAYAAIWVLLGVFSPAVVATITAMPPALITTIAGLALLGPLIGAAAGAFAQPEQRFAATATLVVTASGVAAFGISAAFWGLITGLALHLAERRR